MPSVAAPPPRSSAPATPVAGQLGRGDPANRSILIGLVGTVLLHLLAYFTLPKTFRVAVVPGAEDEVRDLEILLASDDPPPPEPFRFVETNPDAPANEPDQTENFAAMDQQAAQEEPEPDDSELPRTEGREIPSTAIVTGERANPVEVQQGLEIPPTPEPAATVAAAETGATAEAVAPLPGFEKIEGDDEEGIGTNIAEISPHVRPVDERVEGEEQDARQDPDLLIAATPVPQAGRPVPQPRPRVQNVRPAILAHQPGSASQAGRIAVNARFSEFGDYLQELIDVVDAQWNRILRQMSTYPPAGSVVTVVFRINSQGEVKILDVEEGTAGRPGALACVNAITARMPYRPWTREMVAVLGTEQDITFGFYYW
jgi:hypothetical protein